MSLQWLRRWLWPDGDQLVWCRGPFHGRLGTTTHAHASFRQLKPQLLDETLIKRLVDRLKLDPDALAVADAEPAEAYPGTAMIITGNHFSAARFDNIVEVGGKPAFVVESSINRLFVITDVTCSSGPIKVTVGADTVAAPHEFLAKPWPGPGSVDPAPPYSFFGRGLPGSGPGGNPLPGGSAPVPSRRRGPLECLWCWSIRPIRCRRIQPPRGRRWLTRSPTCTRSTTRSATAPSMCRSMSPTSSRWSTTPITTTAPTARRAIPTSTRRCSTSSPPRRPRVRWIRASTSTTTA